MNKIEFYLRNANLKDLDEIVNVEVQSFSQNIQEEKSVFKQRILTFNDGFLVFEADKSDLSKSNAEKFNAENFAETNQKKIIGYFCTELWEKIPKTSQDFTLGHDIQKVHSENGKILYISSFALLPDFRGNGNGKKLFTQSLNFFKSKLNFEKILLLVNENWIAAKKIYLSCGFKEIFACKNIFLNDEKNVKTGLFTSDGIVMLLDLA